MLCKQCNCLLTVKTADSQVDTYCRECKEKNRMNEKDPNGFDQHESGAKLDDGKLLAGLVMGDFAHALNAVIEIGTFGASKYTKHGWLSVPNGFERYTDAMQRHYLKEQIEGLYDKDSNLLHAAHLAWNALARLELLIRDLKRTPANSDFK